MITIYDYIIIGFYLVFMLAIGLVFSADEQKHVGLFSRGRHDAVVDDRRVGVDFQLQRVDVHRRGGKDFHPGLLVLLLYYVIASCRCCSCYFFTCLPVPPDARGHADGGDADPRYGPSTNSSSRGSSCRCCCCSAAWD